MYLAGNPSEVHRYFGPAFATRTLACRPAGCFFLTPDGQTDHGQSTMPFSIYLPHKHPREVSKQRNMHSYHPGRRGVRPVSQRPRRPPVGISSALCKFYPGGNCNFGESCRFRHSTSPDKNSSAAATNFAAPPARRFMRQQQQQEPAEGAPSAPYPSCRGVGAPPIPSGGHDRALKPNQLTGTSSAGAAPATSTDVKASGSGKSFSGSDVAKKAKTNTKTSDKRPSSSKLGGSGVGNAKPSASRHPTSSVKKNRRSVTRNAAGGAGGGQPSVDAKSAASGQPNKKKNDKIRIPDDLNPPSDEVAKDDSPTDTTVGVQPATDDAAVNDPSNSTTTTTKKADDGHDNVKDDDERAPHPPIFHPKASEGSNAECEEETDDEWTYDVEEDMRRYWHEDITTTLIAHEELVAVQKRWENARALAKAKANSKEKMQDESNKSGKENDAQDDVPDATGGTDTAERDENGKEEAARVHWDENTVSLKFWFIFVVTLQIICFLLLPIIYVYMYPFIFVWGELSNDDMQ